MSQHHHTDVPLLRTTISIRSPRSVLLLNPYQLCIVLGLFGVSVAFTIWPSSLEHAPVSFEQRGVIHHIWHYALLASTTTVLWGMFSATAQRLRVELVGLCVLAGCIGVNLTAIVADVEARSQVAGIGIGLRSGLLLALCVRAYTIAREPLVDLSPAEGK